MQSLLSSIIHHPWEKTGDPRVFTKENKAILGRSRRTWADLNHIQPAQEAREVFLVPSIGRRSTQSFFQDTQVTSSCTPRIRTPETTWILGSDT